MTDQPYSHLHIYYFDGIPVLEPALEKASHFLGSWEEDGICFLFFSAPADDTAARIDAESPGASLADTYAMSVEEWHGDKIEPYFIHNLCICPPWNRPEPGTADERQVVLDPGVVFGTGRHQTTEDCLYLIHRLCGKEGVRTMVDIGTGTGLLALGAAALGCERVWACDFNRLAVKTCLNNIRLNRMSDRVLAFQARGEQILSIPCDLLVANIHYDVMRHMIDDPALVEKKWVLLSGLLNSEAAAVMKALADKPVQILERRCPDGVWNTILAKRL